MSTPPLDIVFCVPGLPFDGNTLKTGSLGGSESAGIYLARALAKRGHRVKMFCNLPQGSKGGIVDAVDYRPFSLWQGHVLAAPHHVSIIQRAPELCVNRMSTMLTILWCHDLALRRVAHVFKVTRWAVDRIAVLSEFMEKQYGEIIGLDPSALYRTRNGLDLDLSKLSTKNVAPRQARDPDLLLYAARPERGLDVLLEKVFPKILAQRPQTKLALCSYSNPGIDGAPTDWMPRLNEMIKANPQIIPLGSLTKEGLYQVMSRASAYVYPTPGAISPEFAEVSCIAALEAQMCGLPVVCSAAGALPETARASMKCETPDDIAEATLTLLEHPGIWNAIQTRQIEHLKENRYSWDAIAEDWEAMFEAEIVKKNSDPVRLAAWAYPRSDIELARAALTEAMDLPAIDGNESRMGRLGEIGRTLHNEVNGPRYSFLLSDEAYAAHYEACGRETDAEMQAQREAGVFTKEWVSDPRRVPRFAMIAEQIKAAGGIKHILDVGCGHGESPVFIHNNTGATVWGLEVDPRAREWCGWFTEQFANNPAAISVTGDAEEAFVTWPQMLISAKADEAPGYDALICSEILEHVRDPIGLLEKAELAVKPGGLVVITVPYGPWEYDGKCWHGYRNHVRELLQPDIYEMLGHKPGLAVGAAMCAMHPLLGEPCGFYVVTYRADHSGVRPIDMARKLKWQRPKETLSVNMICHAGGESTLRWSLESVRHVADEIVIGDTGMTEEGRALARSFGARIVPAPNPLKEGFDAARNAALDASVGDWILTVDSDERLCDAQEIGKYLRDNGMDGYSLPQVHVTADIPVAPDAPVRLFRRASGNRYLGMVHEHPEKEFNKGPGIVCLLNNPKLLHIGYETNQVRAGRFLRNRPLIVADRAKYPQRVMGIFLDARDHAIMLQETLARTQNRITPQIIEIAEKTLQLCNEYWAAGVPLVNVDPTPFKTDALRVLGRGFEASIDIKIGRDNIGDQGELAARYESEEDFAKAVERASAEKLKQVLGNYW